MVYSTGFGHHADYVFGWKGDSLQKAMDARCDVYDPTPDGAIHPPSECPQLRSQDTGVANECTQGQMAQEELDECEFKPQRKFRTDLSGTKGGWC